MEGIIEYKEPEVSNSRNMTEEMKIQEQRIAMIVKNRKEQQLRDIQAKRRKEEIIITSYDELENIDNVNLVYKDIYDISEGNTISKTEIILKSPYRVYFEEEALSEDQIIFLFFFDLEGGHIGKSCKRMGISRFTINKWKNQNLIFNEIVSDSREFLIDSAEKTIMQAIEQGDVNAAKFVLETQGKNRGYGKHQTITSEDVTTVVGFEFVNVNDSLPLLEAQIEDKK